MSLETLMDDFALFDDWEERYRYIIELGNGLAPLSDAEHSDANKVPGCASQVWLVNERMRIGFLFAAIATLILCAAWSPYCSISIKTNRLAKLLSMMPKAHFRNSASVSI